MYLLHGENFLLSHLKFEMDFKYRNQVMMVKIFN